uniref:Uncharacterized protein n=1 Tax=Rhizophora mucronata TaxID=61149 RepID=A0A2P2IZ54_RHIMU
MSMLKSACKMV